MKKLIYKNISLLCLILFFSQTSCDSWFDINDDDENITSGEYFENADAFYSSLAGIYTELRHNSIYGKELSVSMLEFMAQNFIPDDETAKAMATFNYTKLEEEKYITNIFLNLYHVITSINFIINEIENTTVVFNNSGQKEIITGELYGLRAAIHFDLLRLFHPSYKENPDFVGLPYMKTFNNNVSAPLSSKDFLNYVIEDLEYSLTYLENYDPVITGQIASSAAVGEVDSRLRTFHLNYYAVKAVLARTLLYMGEHEESLNHAKEVFNHPNNLSANARIFYFMTPGNFYDDMSFSREHIFGIPSLATGLTAVSKELFEERVIPVSTKFSDIYNYSSDTRYRTWFELKPDNTFIMENKFSVNSMLNDYVRMSSTGNTSLPVRIPFIKIGEMSLIAAECLNELKDPDGAAQFLIELQNSKNITEVEELKTNGLLNYETLKTIIDKEYQREFWGEGQLFYYYKRLNNKTITSYDGETINMNSDKYTLPIPAGSLSLN